jgi:outer membrane protein assembly factor BamA
MYRQTITRLNNLGIFKFINLQFIHEDDSLVNELDMLVELVVLKNISLDIEGNLVSKSTGFAGPGLVTTLAHGNLAGTASKLRLRLYGGFEWQVNSSSENNTGTMSYQVGASASLFIPGLITPFSTSDQDRFKMPQTSVTLGFELMNKIRYYRMYSFNLGFGYQWNINESIAHQLFPVQVNSAKLLNTTTEFDSLLAENPYIRKSFEEQYIAGSRYIFTYDKSSFSMPHSWYIQAGLKTAGNLVSLLGRGDPGDNLNPDSFLGNVYSQFVRVSADIRYFRNFRNHNLGFRFFTGTGIPYGNSVVMPYVEQFYSGGSNSIRAFPARALGPGGYSPDEIENIVDYTGDMKLEFNMEYRFRLTKVLHGALFMDIGNVWLVNRDASRPGAEFRFDTFTDQLAVGTGFGFRFDLSFFVLRADIGLPLRRPYETDGSYWLGSRKEVRKNATFNFAIGYPF